MPALHDPSFRESVNKRLKDLRPNAQPRWGRMTADQMLWHVNCGLDSALGRLPVAPIRVPLPKSVLKFIVISLPWRKGNTPTAPEFVAKDRYDFEQERSRTFRLIDEFAARPIDGPWTHIGFLGRLTGSEWSRLQGKHLDHHLRQFAG